MYPIIEMCLWIIVLIGTLYLWIKYLENQPDKR